jgi:hypothetical protein
LGRTNDDPFESGDDVESDRSSEEKETNMTVLPGISEYYYDQQ